MTRRESLRSTGWGALIALLISGVGFLWEEIGYEPFVVEGPSMQPTLAPGDRFLLERGAYGLDSIQWAEPTPGDVVVAQSPVDESIVVKRVVAVGGDTIDCLGGVLRINGQVVSMGQDEPCRFDEHTSGCRVRTERFVQGASHRVAWDRLQDFGPIVVPLGSVFLLGDQRDRSNDSRNPLMGSVSQTRILGRVGWTY
ncbi:MAG: signal peptidase I [Polyangiales bacterium]|jgi:signal peptidase I